MPSPLTVNGAAVPPQASANAPSAAVTGSEKVTRTFVSSSTSVAPSAGSVAVTDGQVGSSSQPDSGSAGVRSVKSAALSSVSPSRS